LVFFKPSKLYTEIIEIKAYIILSYYITKSFTNELLTKSSYLKKIINYVNNSELESAFPHCKIVKYADLDQYETKNELIPNLMDFCFTLTKSKYNEGHWTVCIRSGKVFQYFESYGDSSKSILDFIPKYMNKQLGNYWSTDSGNIISQLLKLIGLYITKRLFNKNFKISILAEGGWIFVWLHFLKRA